MLRDIYSRNEKLFKDAESHVKTLGRFRIDKGRDDVRFNSNKQEYTDEIQRLINK